MREHFAKFATWVAAATGSSWAFVIALAIIVVWAVSGPVFGFSDTWQLVINTSTTIVTFLMVFLIQNTQNRDTRAMQLKLDELLRAVEGAHEETFIDLEQEDEKRVEQVHQMLRHECGLCADEHQRHHDRVRTGQDSEQAPALARS